MRKMKRIVLIAYWVLLLLFGFSSAFAGEKVVLTYGEWPPYSSTKLRGGGLNPVLYKAILENAGYEVAFEFAPWLRAYEIALKGPAHGSMGWLKLPEREVGFYFSDQVEQSEMVFFHRKNDTFDWVEIDDLKDKVIGYGLGDALVRSLDVVVSKGQGKLESAPSYVANLKKLAAGRIDLFLSNKVVGEYLLKYVLSPEEAMKITSHPTALDESGDHLIISKRLSNGREIINRFNISMKDMREDGRFDQIVKEYFATDPRLVH